MRRKCCGYVLRLFLAYIAENLIHQVSADSGVFKGFADNIIVDVAPTV